MNKEIKKETKQKNQCKECEQLQQQVEELTLALDKTNNEKEVIQSQLVKVLADYQNLVSNSEKRNEIRFFQTRKSLSESVIPSLDSLSLAIKASESLALDENGKAWLEGINAIFQSLNKSFEELGLKQYAPTKGDKFDHNIHEAVATVTEGKGGEIYDLVSPGYILDNTVIRPARVVVSK